MEVPDHSNRSRQVLGELLLHGGWKGCVIIRGYVHILVVGCHCSGHIRSNRK
jgi:hypothetical protein